MLELESVHIDPLSYDVKPRGDSQRLDLENAVLMQELMAMKVSPCARAHSRQGLCKKALKAGQPVMRNQPQLCSVTSTQRRARAAVCRQGQFQYVRGSLGLDVFMEG